MDRAQGSKNPGLKSVESPAPDAMPEEQVNNTHADSAWARQGFAGAFYSPSKDPENKGLLSKGIAQGGRDGEFHQRALLRKTG